MRIFGEDLSQKKGDNANKTAKPAATTEKVKVDAAAQNGGAEEAEEAKGSEAVDNASAPTETPESKTEA